MTTNRSESTLHIKIYRSIDAVKMKKKMYTEFHNPPTSASNDLKLYVVVVIRITALSNLTYPTNNVS